MRPTLNIAHQVELKWFQIERYLSVQQRCSHTTTIPEENNGDSGIQLNVLHCIADLASLFCTLFIVANNHFHSTVDFRLSELHSSDGYKYY